jgi:hypothetical protein
MSLAFSYRMMGVSGYRSEKFKVATESRRRARLELSIQDICPIDRAHTHGNMLDGTMQDGID